MLQVAKNKIIEFDRVSESAERLRDRGISLVTTNGCFDLIHLGHLSYLEQARSLGQCLWVGINSDESVRALKGKTRPLNPQSVRCQQLAALCFVDYVTVFNERTPEAWLSLVQPQVHVKGGDYDVDDLPEKKIVESAGGKVVCLSFLPGYSTTNMIHQMKDQ